MTQHIYTHTNPTNQRHLEKACNILHSGGILAYPTDVNWAVGCDATNKQALEKIHKLKPNHPKDQPFSLLCNSIAMISKFANVEQTSYRYLKKILPGPYTILLKRNKTLPRQINDKRKIVGVRVPNCPLLQDLIEAFDRPMATTSLSTIPNIGKQYSWDMINYGHQVNEVYGHALDLILDLGKEVMIQETTIIDLSNQEIKLIRKGVGDISMFSNLT